SSGLRQLFDEAERLKHWKRLAREPGSQAAVRHKFHGQIRNPVPPAGPLNWDDVRMSERCPQVGISPEPSFPFLARASPRREDLHGHGLLEWTIEGAIDGAARPAADLTGELIAVPRGETRQPLLLAKRHGGYGLALQEPAQVIGQFTRTRV